MSFFNHDQLGALAKDLNLFQPSGMNDEHRIDLSGGAPFLAVDTRAPHEIDDAFRTRIRKGGGFLVQVAIVDGAQIPYGSDVATDAMRVKASTYRGKRCLESMLPEVAVRQLELSPALNPQRALVIESSYDRDAQPHGDARAFPAMVRVNTYRQAEFASKYLRQNGGMTTPVIRFVEALRQTRTGLDYSPPQALGGDTPNALYGSQVAQDYMILANHTLTQLGEERDIPLLHRRYPSVEATWGRGPAIAIDRTLHLLGRPTNNTVSGEIAYARVTSPLHEGASLANHILFGAHVAGVEASTLDEMAFEMSSMLNA